MTETEALILEKLDIMNQKMTSMDQKMTSMDQKMTSMDQRITDESAKTRIIIENDISRKIDIIGEGHDFLKQRLGDALQMEKKRETMELELINIRMEVKKIKEHLNIA